MDVYLLFTIALLWDMVSADKTSPTIIVSEGSGRWMVGLCIALSIIVALVGVLCIALVAVFYFKIVKKMYHRRLVEKGEQHEVEAKLEPIHYGFGMNKPRHPTEGALERAAHGPSLEVMSPSTTRIARKSSTLEFPGLPTPIHVDGHEH